MCRWRGNAGSGDDLNALRCALGIHSGKIILNSAMPDSLRAVRHCIFTEGVVEENGICSAAFCESAALRLASSPSPSVRFAHCHTPPFVAARHLPPARGKSFLKGRGLGMAEKFLAKVQTLRAGARSPLGELSRSD